MTDIAIVGEIWAALDAATRGRSAFTLGYLGTADGAGRPHVRAVIVRRVDAAASAIYFSTHTRSAKVGELQQNPSVALTFYAPEADVQLRLEGRAEVVTDASAKQDAWDSFGDGTKQLFASPLRPGSPLAAAEPEPGSGPITNFAWVEVHVDTIDAIDLSAEVHRRFRHTRRTTAGSEWAVQRLVP